MNAGRYIYWRGKNGDFPDTAEVCPLGSFVYGYRLKSEASQGEGDDSALNAIELWCIKYGTSEDTGSVTSIEGHRGSWGRHAACRGNNNIMIGFDVKEEASIAGGDNTALNKIDIYCKNNPTRWESAPTQTSWGSWKPPLKCPSGYAVIGLRTQLQSPCVGCDYTGLNGLQLFCEEYKMPRGKMLVNYLKYRVFQKDNVP